MKEGRRERGEGTEGGRSSPKHNATYTKSNRVGVTTLQRRGAVSDDSERRANDHTAARSWPEVESVAFMVPYELHHRSRDTHETQAG